MIYLPAANRRNVKSYEVYHSGERRYIISRKGNSIWSEARYSIKMKRKHAGVGGVLPFYHSLFGGEDHFFELFGSDAERLAFPFDDDDASFRNLFFQVDAADVRLFF